MWCGLQNKVVLHNCAIPDTAWEYSMPFTAEGNWPHIEQSFVPPVLLWSLCGSSRAQCHLVSYQGPQKNIRSISENIKSCSFEAGRTVDHRRSSLKLEEDQKCISLWCLQKENRTVLSSWLLPLKCFSKYQAQHWTQSLCGALATKQALFCCSNNRKQISKPGSSLCHTQMSWPESPLLEKKRSCMFIWNSWAWIYFYPPQEPAATFQRPSQSCSPSPWPLSG